MATIVTGSEGRDARHSTVVAPVGFAISMGVPVAVVVAGVAIEGLGRHHLGRSRRVGHRRHHRLHAVQHDGQGHRDDQDGPAHLLGSAMARPHSSRSRAVGAVVHHRNGAVHPAIRRRDQDDPGTAATNFGAMSPVGSLMGHLVWGAVLGLAYAAWPLG
jgi:hypothetical protein